MLQVGIQAYIMWEKAGKPDGADYSNDARRVLQEQLQSGTAVQVQTPLALCESVLVLKRCYGLRPACHCQEQPHKDVQIIAHSMYLNGFHRFAS